MGASIMLSRASTLVNGTSSIFHNYVYGEDLQNMLENHEQKSFADDLQSSFANTIEKIQEEYIDEETGTLNRKGQKY